MSDDNMQNEKTKIYEISDDNNKHQIIITIESTVKNYDKLNNFIIDLLIKQNKIINKLKLSNINNNNPKINYTLPENEQFKFTYDNNELMCKITKISTDHATYNDIKYLYQLQIIGPSKEIIEKLILEAINEKETLNIYHYSSKCGWSNDGKIHGRDMNTLIFDENVKNKIVNDINKFVNAEKIYDKYGIPYKRNYLFHGLTGTGKTSLVTVIANLTNRSIYVISFDPELTDGNLHNAVSTITSEKAILLLEDIDCIFQTRDTNMNKSNVSFSALLNILDGVSRRKSLITIITSNHVQKLDPALIRPGRVDVMIEFGKISNEQINGLLKLFDKTFSSNVIKSFSKICTSQNLTPAVVSGFLFTHCDDLSDDNHW